MEFDLVISAVHLCLSAPAGTLETFAQRLLPPVRPLWGDVQRARTRLRLPSGPPTPTQVDDCAACLELVWRSSYYSLVLSRNFRPTDMIGEACVQVLDAHIDRLVCARPFPGEREDPAGEVDFCFDIATGALRAAACAPRALRQFAAGRWDCRRQAFPWTFDT